MFAAASDMLQETGHTVGDALHALGTSAQHAALGTLEGVQHLLQELKNGTNKRLAGFSRIHRIEIQDDSFEKPPPKR